MIKNQNHNGIIYKWMKLHCYLADLALKITNESGSTMTKLDKFWNMIKKIKSIML